MKGNAAIVLALAMLAAGCSIKVSPDAVPAPISLAPTPAASAGVPKYVCSTAYKILTDGAVRLAADRSRAGETLTGMASELDAEAAGTGDPGLQQALRDMSADLTAGAQRDDPWAYVEGNFTTVGQKLDGHCG
ncbi:hypothetical protein HH310_26600 [Actinoplanes sp. TBRC 11911]|uniref:hypothetical protein n=1 Tax=Actinoplanes sp. TBRC 11911 TaxID=2729386 RepID=UPI00145E2726|nr:hypothetical protein [Actinoplanes sp. TBRC 11911]NMO54745.1 hypothetical protein [Actinoplanes sp. TBRC 11911]